MRAIPVLVITVLLGLLAGCGSTLRSDVVTFHQQPLPDGETIQVRAVDPQKGETLEFRRYAELINEQLRDIGYTPLPPDSDQQPELIAEVDYEIELGPTEVHEESRRQPFSRYHFHYGRHFDPFYFGLFDTWRPGFYDHEVYTVNAYLRQLELNIREAGPDGERLFEGRVESVGRDRRLPDIMPYLVTAMFSNFPGESGVTKVVTIERNGQQANS